MSLLCRPSDWVNSKGNLGGLHTKIYWKNFRRQTILTDSRWFLVFSLGALRKKVHRRGASLISLWWIKTFSNFPPEKSIEYLKSKWGHYIVLLMIHLRVIIKVQIPSQERTSRWAKDVCGELIKRTQWTRTHLQCSRRVYRRTQGIKDLINRLMKWTDRFQLYNRCGLCCREKP